LLYFLSAAKLRRGTVEEQLWWAPGVSQGQSTAKAKEIKGSGDTQQ